jgi:uncharacterized peroxidase-related enzyme
MTDRILALDLPTAAPLPEDLAARQQEARERLGFAPNLFAGYAHVPQRLRNFLAMRDELAAGTPSLSAPEREMIAVVVSAENRCHYCTVSHSAALRRMTGDAVLVDTLAINYRAAALSKRQRAMLDFAVALTRQPQEIGETHRAALRAAGFSETDIWDIVEVAAFFNMTNRFASGVGMHPNPEYHALGR